MNLIKLGVNIDHAATLRQARGTTYPDLTRMAQLCEQAGADGITIHLREDRRHIQDADVTNLRRTIRTRLNLEMANAPDVVQIALDTIPDEICMVPERRQELTTESGLDAAGLFDTLQPTVRALKGKGIHVSLFIDPNPDQIRAAAKLGAEYIELHTGAYARGQAGELQRLFSAAELAASLGLRVNAGHGLDYENVKPLLQMPALDTLNIGHSIICRAVEVGLAQSVREMIAILRPSA